MVILPNTDSHRPVRYEINDDDEQVGVVSDEDDSEPDRVLHEGEVFAYGEMLIKSTHTRTTRAHGHVELLAIYNSDFMEVLRLFPEVYQDVYQYALEKYDYSLDT